MIDAMHRASAGRITAVIPYFGYARQDRKAKSRDPISAKLVANLITAAGADRVLTMDLHAAQIQGFFDIPVDNLFGAPLFAKHYIDIYGRENDDIMVVSPDVGSTARARNFSMKLGCNMAIVDKRREKANQSEVMNIIGNVEGKTCILLDDMVDTLNADEYGVGLAAPQVGILKRMVVIDIGEGMIELINPVIVETSGSQTGYEACLSVPGVKGIVTRPNYVKVEALNRKGEKFTVDGTELLARAFCHEIDHLDGILYIDHVEGELQSSYEDFEGEEE